MYVTYVLHSKKFNKIYIGCTPDLENRMHSHNHKAIKGYTTKYRPWVVIYTENFTTKKETIKRERALKTAKGGRNNWDALINDPNF